MDRLEVLFILRSVVRLLELESLLKYPKVLTVSNNYSKKTPIYFLCHFPPPLFLLFPNTFPVSRPEALLAAGLRQASDAELAIPGAFGRDRSRGQRPPGGASCLGNGGVGLVGRHGEADGVFL